MNESEQIARIKKYLSDPVWRITSGVLYFIKDKNGKKVRFKLNSAQMKYYKARHKKNIILKARQLGFTTLLAIMLLDETLFSSFKTHGMIAQDTDKVRDLYDNKIKFAYDNLPKWLHSLFSPRIDRQGEIKFDNNNCSISVGTSFRSGTLQHLHISEYGKICAKAPDKAREIKTGSLNAVGPGQQIDIESTAEGASGDFYDKCMQAIALQEQGKELSDMDYKFHFFPWYEDETYSIDGDEPITQETQNYFDLLVGDEWYARTYQGKPFTEWQKRWYQKKKQEQSDDMKREYPSTPKEAFELATEGAYYARELSRARLDGRITRLAHDPNLPVYTAWDLGGAGGWDNTAIWFFQVFGMEIRIINYFEGNFLSLVEIANYHVLRKPYTYACHYLPHDSKVAELSSGITRFGTLQKILGNVRALDIAPIADGINTVRQLFPRFYIDEVNCPIGITKIGLYHKKYNKSTGMYYDTPEHDDSSNPADALRYLCTAVALYHTPRPATPTTKKMFFNRFTGKMEEVR